MEQGDSQRLQALWQAFDRGELAHARQGAAAWFDQGDAPPALDMLRAAIAIADRNPARAVELYRGLALAGGELAAPARMGWSGVLRDTGDGAGAERVLEELLQQFPQHFLGRLQLAELQEQRGARAAALAGYYAAVVQAQRQGRWLGEDTTAPGLRARVKHAMEAIDAGREGLFLALLEPLRQTHGRDALKRVERGLLMYLGALPAEYADPSQQPTFFYVPDVPAMPYPPRELFPWLDELEQATAQIRAEMLATRDDPQAYAPFLGVDADALGPGLLAGHRGKPSWDAYFLFRHGLRDEAHARQCPATAAVLERTPLVRIRDHAPEICFSVLTPGSHILPHRGVTNTRLTTHLPLVVPEDCALLAGGQLHEWREGRAMVFDDTFEHEAWNRSDKTRVILLMDTWNPYLQPVECEAVTRLVEGIGDFNRQAGID